MLPSLILSPVACWSFLYLVLAFYHNSTRVCSSSQVVCSFALPITHWQLSDYLFFFADSELLSFRPPCPTCSSSSLFLTLPDCYKNRPAFGTPCLLFYTHNQVLTSNLVSPFYADYHLLFFRPSFPTRIPLVKPVIHLPLLFSLSFSLRPRELSQIAIALASQYAAVGVQWCQFRSQSSSVRFRTRQTLGIPANQVFILHVEQRIRRTGWARDGHFSLIF